MIGKLIFLIVTRSDITFVIGMLSRYMQLHWTVAYYILRYLKWALRKRLYYHHSSHLNIVRYSDANWVGDPIDHPSITDHITFIRGNLVIWRCNKQNVT